MDVCDGLKTGLGPPGFTGNLKINDLFYFFSKFFTKFLKHFIMMVVSEMYKGGLCALTQ